MHHLLTKNPTLIEKLNMYEISVEELKKTAEKFKYLNSKSTPPNHDCYPHSKNNNLSLVSIDELQQPKRKGDRIWFRSKENIESILMLMILGEYLPPIEVFSKGRKCIERYAIRDGFHRYYASLAMGFKLIPIKINDWEFEDVN